MKYIEVLGIDHDRLIDSIQRSGPKMSQRQALIGHCLKTLEQFGEDDLLLVLELLTAVQNARGGSRGKRRTYPPKRES